MAVPIPGEKVKGIFLHRPNRFQAVVEIDGRREVVHVPNTGRMNEMLHPGTEVVLSRSDNPKRKHPFSLTFVNKNNHWICIHSALANRVFEEAVLNGRVDWVSGKMRREVPYGASRMDFQVEGDPATLIEVKCVTYEEDGIAKFPDAPTLRGQKHIGELIRAAEEGYRGAVVLVVFMDFVTSFTPHDGIDPLLGAKLREAASKGIPVRAYTCSIRFDAIRLAREIPVVF
ncbi:DNA/RNA nuclease SfsA [Salinithrix halophila]|uniref:Sugar fermentation stimulation protein homolog n=1 Tax=Salinithrix halophila TaxID=1485204 RepID=A0ABV8JFS3_9BACL